MVVQQYLDQQLQTELKICSSMIDHDSNTCKVWLPSLIGFASSGPASDTTMRQDGGGLGENDCDDGRGELHWAKDG